MIMISQFFQLVQEIARLQAALIALEAQCSSYGPAWRCTWMENKLAELAQDSSGAMAIAVVLSIEGRALHMGGLCRLRLVL